MINILYILKLYLISILKNLTVFLQAKEAVYGIGMVYVLRYFVFLTKNNNFRNI